MKIIKNKTLFLITLIFIVEAFSFAAYFYYPLKTIGFLLITLITLIVSIKNLENGLLILFTELIIGSKGHLFNFGPVSLRMAIFAVIIAVYVSKLFRKTERVIIFQQLKEFYLKKYLIIFSITILLSLLVAFLNKNNYSTIFADFNAWLFFLIFFPILYSFSYLDEQKNKKLLIVIQAAFICLSLKTLLILYLFTHNIGIISDLYLWLRKTGVAEITNTLGSWPRIFLQSHIYAPLVLVFFSFYQENKKHFIWIFTTLAWTLSLISMSRSFWLALILVLIISLILQLLIFSWKRVFAKLLLIVGSFLAALILIISISLFPIPNPGNFSSNSFINRVSLNNGEAAVASRWSLLPVLWQEINNAKIIGHGFGKTISYQSSDPRVLQNNPNGEYTTYAFEWGYLAMWLKLGLLGLIAYLFIIFKIVKKGLENLKKPNVLNISLVLGLILISIVHFFTPYLDHPLGIAYLSLIAVIISKQKVTLPESEK